jgi:crotonobetainyl-CoA:carnitine CoA-transferase CaiB-like acyl-CoA transferase
MQGPLTGVRIIAVEQFGAGPFGTLYLSDMGAEVIKIEDPSFGGDVGRYVPPGQAGASSLFFETFNRGKRSVALDLKSPAGREVFNRLVATADAVYNNLRGDQPARLGLTYQHLAPLNSKIVCVSLSGYGQDGPRAAEPGYDALVQAEAGWASLTGEPDGPPVKTGLSLADYAAGLVAGLALMIGLFNVTRTGKGCDADTNLYDTALAMLTYPATWFLSGSHQVGRSQLSAHPSLVPFQFFRTCDGYIAIACAKEKFFRALMHKLGLDSLAEDQRFNNFESRLLHRQELLSLLEERFATRSTADWCELLRGDVPVAPVHSLDEALNRSDLISRGMLMEYTHEELGTVASIAPPFRVGDFRPTPRRAPMMGEDASELLATLGYSDREVEALGASGAFGTSTHSSPTGSD